MTLKILFPWWLKIFIKVILSRLPVKYSTWRSISLFCHSAPNVNESATALKIIENIFIYSTAIHNSRKRL